MNNKELFAALEQMEKEKGIPVDYMLEQIERAIKVACKNNYGGNDNVVFKVNREKGTFDVKLVKVVVADEDLFDDNYEVTLEQAQKKRKRIAVGDEMEIPLDPKQLGRIAVQTARSVIRQGIRDGEKGQMRKEFESRLGELVTATVERVDPTNGMATIKIGKAIATLPRAEQVGDRVLKEGDQIKVLVADIKDNERGPRAMISRTSPELVKRLFEQEVPEIFDGVVEIKAIAREAGSRTKMAVFSNDENVDAIGSCIGTRGDRVNTIVDELGNEKIDIIEYSDDPMAYIASALSPATVLKVDVVDESAKSCKVTVPDGQLSLAIGNKGQNARLAARLTGWKIDIRPESGFYGEEEDTDEAETEAEVETEVEAESAEE